jgi:hypothetical protein
VHFFEIYCTPSHHLANAKRKTTIRDRVHALPGSGISVFFNPLYNTIILHAIPVRSPNLLVPINTKKLVLFRTRGRLGIGILEPDALMPGNIQVKVLVFELGGASPLREVDIDRGSIARSFHLNVNRFSVLEPFLDMNGGSRQSNIRKSAA